MRQNIENYTLGKFISQKQSAEHRRSSRACPHFAFTNNHLKCKARGWLFHLIQIRDTHCSLPSPQARLKFGYVFAKCMDIWKVWLNGLLWDYFSQAKSTNAELQTHTNAPFTIKNSLGMREDIYIIRFWDSEPLPHFSQQQSRRQAEKLKQQDKNRIRCAEKQGEMSRPR